MPDTPPGRNRPVRGRVEAIEWVSLVAALAPFVIAVVRAAVQHWMPVGDAAYFTVRSRDVFTAHPPLVGAWSSGSSVVGLAVNNLGPLQLDLLAPFTTISPYLGTGIGSARDQRCLRRDRVGVARRLFGPCLVVAVMAGTLLLIATLGLSWLIDARQQFALVLPFYALLWFTAAMWAAKGFAVPLALAVASLVLQTHFTYAYQAVIVTAVGVAAYAASVIRQSAPIGARRRGQRRRGVGAGSSRSSTSSWDPATSATCSDLPAGARTVPG